MKKEWGKAKLELMTLSAEIKALSEAGNSVLSIYSLLNQSGKITIGERTFRRYAGAIIADSTDKQVSSPQTPASKAKEISRTGPPVVVSTAAPAQLAHQTIATIESTAKKW